MKKKTAQLPKPMTEGTEKRGGRNPPPRGAKPDNPPPSRPSTLTFSYPQPDSAKPKHYNVDKLLAGIKHIIDYPSKGSPRRSKTGYPVEMVYDQYAYERMVDSYRDGLNNLLKEFDNA